MLLHLLPNISFHSSFFQEQSGLGETFMLSLYYQIWVDAILVTKSAKGDEARNWKLFTIIPISALQGTNLFTILLFIRSISSIKFSIVLPMRLFSVVLLDDFISALLTFFVPFVLLNYLLIFNNGHYNELMKTYKSSSRKFYFWYFALSVGILAVPLIARLLF
jgi:hypothetical protein